MTKDDGTDAADRTPRSQPRISDAAPTDAERIYSRRVADLLRSVWNGLTEEQRRSAEKRIADLRRTRKHEIAALEQQLERDKIEGNVETPGASP